MLKVLFELDGAENEYIWNGWRLDSSMATSNSKLRWNLNDFVFISRNWDTICINLHVVGAEQEMIEHFIFSLCLLVFLKTFEFKLSFCQSASYIPFSCLNFEIAKKPSGIAYINFKFSIILYVALLQLIISSSF